MIAPGSWLGRLKSSSPMGINQRARELRAAGHDVINLSIGAPDFDTPDNVRRAAVDAIDRGQTRYTNVDGTPELKRAVREKFRRENGLDYDLDQISVGVGGKQVIFNALLATLDGGDEVVIPAPHYPSYLQIARIADATPKIVPCAAGEGFKMSPDELAAAITGKTRWLVLNSPNNPTGAAYDAAELSALAEVLRRHPAVAVLSDDIYERYLYDGARFATIAAVAPDLCDRTLTVNGVSKTYGMTGWRIGYAGGPKELIGAMARIQYQCTTSPCSVSQAAAVEAIMGPQDMVDERVAAFELRRDLVVGLLNGTPGVSCRPPQGSIYTYPDCAGLIGRRTPGGGAIESDTDLAVYLLETEGVSVLPGAAYGLSPYLRVSFAAAEDALREGCRRIVRACARLESV